MASWSINSTLVNVKMGRMKREVPIIPDVLAKIGRIFRPYGLPETSAKFGISTLQMNEMPQVGA
jgi:hypothetical protein